MTSVKARRVPRVRSRYGSANGSVAARLAATMTPRSRHTRNRRHARPIAISTSTYIATNGPKKSM